MSQLESEGTGPHHSFAFSPPFKPRDELLLPPFELEVFFPRVTVPVFEMLVFAPPDFFLLLGGLLDCFLDLFFVCVLMWSHSFLKVSDVDKRSEKHYCNQQKPKFHSGKRISMLLFELSEYLIAPLVHPEVYKQRCQPTVA